MTDEFHGRAGEMRNSQWLAKEDFEGRGDVAATIEGVYVHRDVEFEGGRKQKVAYSLKFSGIWQNIDGTWQPLPIDRASLLNAARRSVLVRARGTDVDNWIGCTVMIYVDPTVKVAGKTVGGYRFRDDVKPPKVDSKDTARPD